MPIKLHNVVVYVKSDGVLGLATRFYAEAADVTWWVDGVEFRMTLWEDEFVKVNNVR